jgi:hypothetical protein
VKRRQLKTRPSLRRTRKRRPLRKNTRTPRLPRMLILERPHPEAEVDQPSKEAVEEELEPEVNTRAREVLGTTPEEATITIIRIQTESSKTKLRSSKKENQLKTEKNMAMDQEVP